VQGEWGWERGMGGRVISKHFCEESIEMGGEGKGPQTKGNARECKKWVGEESST
jgi:hypothetical protein